MFRNFRKVPNRNRATFRKFRESFRTRNFGSPFGNWTGRRGASLNFRLKQIGEGSADLAAWTRRERPADRSSVALFLICANSLKSRQPVQSGDALWTAAVSGTATRPRPMVASAHEVRHGA
jgi:hypothetical protein